jgi:hypothetical protein
MKPAITAQYQRAPAQLAAYRRLIDAYRLSASAARQALPARRLQQRPGRVGVAEQVRGPSQDRDHRTSDHLHTEPTLHMAQDRRTVHPTQILRIDRRARALGRGEQNG